MMLCRARIASILVFCLSLLLTLGTGAAAFGNPQLISGDFNGDGQLDALTQPVDDTGPTSIVLSDSMGQLTIPGQSWPAGYLGLNWGQSNSVIHVGDLTGSGRDDILVQSLTTGGPSAVLLSDPMGQFLAINQSIPTPYLGLDWSAASHQILPGKFGGGLQSEVLLQTMNPGGQNMIVQPNSRGMLVTTAQTWVDGYLGLHWDAQDVTLYVGDFTGNGQDGLLMQVQSTAVESNSAPYTLLLPDAQGQFTEISQTWGLNAFGADWTPTTHTLLIEDVNGDGIADIVLMAKTAGGTNYLVVGNNTGHFSGTAIKWQGTMTPQQALQLYYQTSTQSAGIEVTQSPSSKKTAAVKLTNNLIAPNSVGTMGGAERRQRWLRDLQHSDCCAPGPGRYAAQFVAELFQYRWQRRSWRGLVVKRFVGDHTLPCDPCPGWLYPRRDIQRDVRSPVSRWSASDCGYRYLRANRIRLSHGTGFLGARHAYRQHQFDERFVRSGLRGWTESVLRHQRGNQ